MIVVLIFLFIALFFCGLALIFAEDLYAVPAMVALVILLFLLVSVDERVKENGVELYINGEVQVDTTAIITDPKTGDVTYEIEINW